MPIQNDCTEEQDFPHSGKRRNCKAQKTDECGLKNFGKGVKTLQTRRKKTRLPDTPQRKSAPFRGMHMHGHSSRTFKTCAGRERTRRTSRAKPQWASKDCQAAASMTKNAEK